VALRETRGLGDSLGLFWAHIAALAQKEVSL
jgi:hypothetical protein